MRTIRGGRELLDRVGPLWERLNAHHALVSPHFAPFFRSRDFAWRRATLHEGELLVVLAVSEGEDVGYVLASRKGEMGEVESLFVAEGHRDQGLGGALLDEALVWVEGCERVRIGVAAGNEEALRLYGRRGFVPRVTILERPGE